jgi:putative two-component system response regulator
MAEKSTLMIVEDNHDLRMGLKVMLTGAGFNILAASNGKEALALMDINAPDLILSDITMPEMDGYAFFDAVRSRTDWIAIPFIFLTARGEREDVMRGKNLGAEDYLVKPVTRAELLAAVEAKLQRFHQLQMVQLEQAYEASLAVLANVIEARDRYTRGHVERVRDYALVIASQLGVAEAHKRALRFGALLHDIGKILVRETTLMKADPLSPDEWNEIRQHPVIGAEMLKDIPYLAPAVPIVRHHHERWDGNGYPDGLMGEDIPMDVRIVSLADGFDAMTTTRPYHPAWPFERAYEEILRGSNSYFDPHVADAFREAWAAQKIQVVGEAWINRSKSSAQKAQKAV